MPVFKLTDVIGTHFPAGRHTRVLAGPGAPTAPDHFVMGHVTIFPGGSVPAHSHDQEEIYFIASGSGVMEIDSEATPVEAGSYAAIAPQQRHSLVNNSQENMVMIFCYAPAGVVEHWQQELQSSESQ